MRGVPTKHPRIVTRTPSWHFWVSAPFIYGLFIPLVVMDVLVEIYQNVCFRLYGLERLKRKRYIFIDYGQLKQLGWFHKINCIYCGYANGLAAYFVAIAAETERYWCAIKNEGKLVQKVQPHQKEFFPRKRFE